jgi:cytochrome c556
MNRSLSTRGFFLLLLVFLLLGKAVAGEHTLKSIMQGLGRDIAELTRAMMADDMPAVTQAAAAIADHPRPNLGERLYLLGRMGADTEEFQQHDARVHQLAVRVKQAAEAGDRPSLEAGYQQLTAACLACHHRFRDAFRASQDAGKARL